MTDAYHGQKFLIRKKNGVLLATPLLAVLVLVEVTDIVFAVDSIPAIFAVTDEPFLGPRQPRPSGRQGRWQPHHLSASPGRGAGGPHLEAYLASREDEALALLEQRRGQDRAVLGLESVWLASRWERPEMLAVEVDCFFPARISPDGDSLLAADDVEHPDVIDDVVDELVEQVLARGAWVALIEPGGIPDNQRVALTTRRR
jgi:hypothetical protein